MRASDIIRVRAYVVTPRNPEKFSRDPRICVEAPPVRARYSGECVCCKANYSAGRMIYFSSARDGWVIAMPHNKAGEHVKRPRQPKERKQPLVRRSRLARPLSVVCPVCVLDVDECNCRKGD